MSGGGAVVPLHWAGRHSALNPAGVAAVRVDHLWRLMLTLSTAVYVVVVLLLLYAAFRRRGADESLHGTETNGAAAERRRQRVMTRSVSVGVVVTIAILFVVLFDDFFTGRAVAVPLHIPGALRVAVIGHQWWWEVQYDAPNPQQRLTTANEIHVPVGRPVLLTLTSQDVIHSFWVPSLNGKTDLIPGYQAVGWFRADTPGVYRGQCAEFCGFQHGKMALLVIAEPPARFAAWYNQQLQPASTPADSVRTTGQRVFLTGACSNCHTIRGTNAAGTIGPELTHVASRLTLAAGTFPNTTGNLAGWVVDPQQIKPGSAMPPNNLAPQDLQALLAYLGGLR